MVKVRKAQRKTIAPATIKMKAKTKRNNELEKMCSSQENLKQESRIWNFLLESVCTSIAMSLSSEEAILYTLGKAVTL